MLRALASEAPERKSPAIEYFSAHGSESGVAALEWIVGSGSRHLSFQALHALARIGGDEARDFEASVAEGEGPLAEAALGALTMLPEGSEEAKQIALEQLARDDRGGSSVQALQLIATDESEEARAALIAAADGEGPTSAHALMLLSQRSDDESRRALARIAGSTRSPEQQVQVLQALVQTGDAAMLDTVRAHHSRPH